jgi:hypothetical protein
MEPRERPKKQHRAATEGHPYSDLTDSRRRSGSQSNCANCFLRGRGSARPFNAFHPIGRNGVPPAT